MNGHIHPVKEAFSGYMKRWYESLFSDTAAVAEYRERGLARSVIWVPGRMVDAAEEMLEAYRRNANPGDPGHKSLLPIVMVGMSKDYTPTTPDRGRQTPGRRLIKIVDDQPDDQASIYGYRQAMGDIRTQVVVAAAEEPTAKSLAAQFSLWVAEIKNRRFHAAFTWGQYTVQMPVMLETPDITFMEVQTGTKNLTMLAADINLSATFPYFDAPAEDDDNDGTEHNPPGYPVVLEVNSTNSRIPWESSVTGAGVVFSDPR